jgi:ribosome biogenesis GTPase A
MAKSLRMMSAEVKNIDAIIYVLDARAPLSCLNPVFLEMIGNKPVLFILNKIDLADSIKIKSIKSNLKTENSDVLELNSTASGALKAITNSLNNLCKSQIERFKNKGVNYFVRAMVIGVPNSGKSTLVNNLCGSAKAATGDKPGVTKGKQWVKLSNNIEILDTPGVLWPNLENKRCALNLAYIGSIKDEVVSIFDLSLNFIEDMIQQYKSLFFARFKLTEQDVKDKTSYEILELIGRNRKYLIKGGEVDLERTAFTIIDDFRKGKIGKITLDD